MRYDRNAVYLGTPGSNQQCPPHLVGRADTVSIAPSGGAGLPVAGPAIELQSAEVGGRPAAAAAPRPRVTLTATYGADPEAVRQVLGSVRSAGTGAPAVLHQLAPAAQPAATLPVSTSPLPPSGTLVRTSYMTTPMPGFDTCTAPSVQAMQAWRQSYSAAAIYIGGVDMACGYGNLSASWVQSVRAMGWTLIPIYVGRQAPCDSFSTQIWPSQAAPEGTWAATDAVHFAQSLGLGPGSPIYFDMEAYNSGDTSCRDSVLSFMNAWDTELGALHYVSGMYSSAASGVEDMGNATSVYGRTMVKPQSIWFALWDNQANLIGTPYLLSSWWTSGNRIKQYEGGHSVTVGGFQLNIDSDWVEGAVYG